MKALTIKNENRVKIHIKSAIIFNHPDQILSVLKTEVVTL